MSGNSICGDLSLLSFKVFTLALLLIWTPSKKDSGAEERLPVVKMCGLATEWRIDLHILLYLL